jgi:hypothetical protein
MIIYLVIFFSVFLLLWLSEAEHFRTFRSKILTAIALLLPSILAGLRDYSIGGDISAYGNYWFRMSRYATKYIPFITDAHDYSIGYGYATLNFIVSRFTDNSHWFYFILCLFELVVLFLALIPFKDQIRVPYAFLIYFLLYYNDSLNNMRQFPAILILMVSYQFICRRKIVPFIITVLLAMTFHATAIIGFLLYPLSWVAEGRFKKYILWLVAIGTIVASMTLRVSLTFFARLGILEYRRYEHYLTDQDVIGGRFIRIILFLSIFIMFTLNKQKIINNGNGHKILINTLYYYATISLLFTAALFTGASGFIIRIAHYFDFFMIFYVSAILKCRKN